MREIELRDAPFGTVVGGWRDSSFAEVRVMVIGPSATGHGLTEVVYLTDEDPWHAKSGVAGTIGHFGGGGWPVHSEED